MTLGRISRMTAIAALVTLFTPLMALAQQSLTVSSATAGAGSEVVLNIALSDTTGIAGANLTVKLANNDVLTFKKFDGTNVSELATATSSWQKDENLVSATELRIVAYSAVLPPVGLGAGSDVDMVKIHLQVAGGAATAATAQVSLDNGVDTSVTPNVGLTRLSDAAGVSITPTVNPGTVTVDVPAFPPVAFDFNAGQGDWTVIQVRNTFDGSGNPPMKVTEAGAAIGLKVLVATDTFGFYSAPASSISAVAQDNILMRADWTLSSSGTAADSPAFRMRFNASDASVAEMTEIQSSDTIVGGRLSPGNTPKVFSQYFVQSASARNAIGPAGYYANLDLEAFDARFSGPADSVIWLDNLEVKGAVVDTSAPTPVAGFNYDFTASGTDAQGWLGIVPPTLYGLDGTGFANTIAAEANNGLILRSINTPHDAPEYKFSFGIWMSPEVTLTGSAISLYRLKLTIVSQTGNVVETPHFRARINAGDGQWTRHFEVIRKDIDPAMAPSASGTEYFVYFNYPAELNNVPVRVSVDQINDRAEDDANGAFKLTKASLEQIPMPTYN